MLILTILEIIVAVMAFITGIVGLVMFDMSFHWALSPFLSGLAMVVLAIGNIRL
jgi:hypothetical protein